MRDQQFPAKHDPVDLICAVLRGETADWPEEPEFADGFVSAARYHGVAALLNGKSRSDWPHSVREPLRQDAVGQAAWELRHRQVLHALLEKLALADVTPILFKGTALAYDLYGSPLWRTRGDTDMITMSASLEGCRQVLAECGFSRTFAMPGELASNEETWKLEGPLGGHAIDLHRKLNNSAVLSKLLPFEELLAASQLLPALSPHAIRIGDVHALLIACMHRATHRNAPYYVDGTAHYGGDRLIWLIDIDLLAQRFSEAGWAAFVSLARVKGLCATSLEALNTARACIGTDVPAFVLMALAAEGKGRRPDIYLRSDTLRQSWMDFQAIDGVAAKASFLKEVVFPPGSYMRAKYRGARGPLPYLYLHRAMMGVVGRVSRSTRK